MENLKYIILGIAVLMYVLVIAFQEKKVWFTSIAAAAVILLGIILPGQIFPIEGMANGSALYLRSYALTHSIGEIINWNVILIYLL